MTTRHASGADRATPGRYEVRFRGVLDDRWEAWFDGLTVTANGDGTTSISGHFSDQAAIHGVLERVRDLGVALISVTPTDRRDPDQEESKP
jgi:hypothetical protein